MLRADIVKAVEQTPPKVQGDLRGGGATALGLLDAHLPEDETVTAVSSAAVKGGSAGSPLDCVLAVTSRRVVFVAPRPQAISLPLRAVTRFQVTMDYLFLEGAGKEYALGIDRDWGPQLEHQVHPAVAEAVLADR